MIEEIWKPVVGFEGLYEVSNLGRIKSLPRNSTKGRILKPLIDKHGYLTCTPCKNNKKTKLRVHRMVADAYLGPNPDKLDINHKDGNKLNCAESNLEYCTRKENINHAIRLGLFKLQRPPIRYGEDHGNSKLSTEDVNKIRKIGDSIPSRKVAKLFKVSKTQVLDIRKNKTRKNG